MEPAWRQQGRGRGRNQEAHGQRPRPPPKEREGPVGAVGRGGKMKMDPPPEALPGQSMINKLFFL